MQAHAHLLPRGHETCSSGGRAGLVAHGLRGFEEYHRYLLFDPGADGEARHAIDLLTTNETWPSCSRSSSRLRAGEILHRG